MQNHFARLPTELVLHICTSSVVRRCLTSSLAVAHVNTRLNGAVTFLRAKDICRVSQACFTFWSLVDHNEDRLWEVRALPLPPLSHNAKALPHRTIQALFQRRWVHSRDKLMDAFGCSRYGQLVRLNSMMVWLIISPRRGQQEAILHSQ
jgi:hypothetical protein